MTAPKVTKKPAKQPAKQPEKEKERNINNEIRRLTNIFKDIEKNKRLSTKGLIEEAAYMKATLVALREGCVDRNSVARLQV